MKFILRELAQEVAEHLQNSKLGGRTVGIKVRLDSFKNLTRAHTLDYVTNDAREISSIVCHLLNHIPLDGHKVRLLGVRVSGFSPGEWDGSKKSRPIQLTFWD